MVSNKQRNLVITLSFIFAIYLVGCQSGTKKQSATFPAGQLDTLHIVTVNWTDNIALSHLVEHIAEEEMGQPVKLTRQPISQAYTKLGNQEFDLFLSSWQPHTHREYWQNHQDELIKLGSNYKQARIGLAVPAYMNTRTIPGLKKIKDSLGGRIIGIEEGAGIVTKTEEAIEAYGLDYRVVGTSEPAMIATLEASLKEKEAIVITAWKPHWLFSEHDLRFLKDPQQVYGQGEQIYSVARKGFQEDFPEIASFLQDFNLQEEQMLGLLAEMQKTDGNPAKGIKTWIEAHRSFIDQLLDEAGS